MMAEHDRKVERIARRLRAHTGTRPLSLRKRAVAHQVPKNGDRRRNDDKIDLTDLDAILHVDPERRICVAEPGVTFVDLVRATMRHGLAPIIVPELKTITIGGAVSGCSIESMSFKHGGFHDTCLEYEVITATGDVIVCTPDNEHQLVFQMMHGAFGTLGILSKLTFRLVPAKPFVRLRNVVHRGLDDYLDAIRGHRIHDDVDFMDGIIHAPDAYALCTGDFVDRAPYTSRYDWMKVYYQSTRSRGEDYMTTEDYFFRYDRGVTNVRPSSWLGRLLFGKFVASSEMLAIGNKLSWALPKRKPTVTLDVFVPISRVPAFFAWWNADLAFYPLWCVPYRRVRDYEWLDGSFYRGLDDDLFIDLAIYGMKQKDDRNLHKVIEDKLVELGGIKTLIAHNYYSEDEFWRIWNKPNYDSVKAVTDPKNLFRDLYTKTCRAAMGLD
jgi:FAD/FMN-containing dehydrogenase